MVASPQIGRKLRDKRARKEQENTTGQARMTGAQTAALITQNGAFGAWADRQDIEDSSAYARELREAAQRRERD